MLDLDARLRDQFAEIVRDLAPPDRLDDLVHDRRRQRIRRRRRAAGGLTALALVAAVVVTTKVLPGDEDSSVVTGSSEQGDGPLFLVPGGPLPEGFGLLQASGGD